MPTGHHTTSKGSLIVGVMIDGRTIAHGIEPISFSISLSVTPFVNVYVLGKAPKRLGVIIASCSGFNVLRKQNIRTKIITFAQPNAAKIEAKHKSI